MVFIYAFISAFNLCFQSFVFIFLSMTFNVMENVYDDTKLKPKLIDIKLKIFSPGTDF